MIYRTDNQVCYMENEIKGCNHLVLTLVLMQYTFNCPIILWYIFGGRHTNTHDFVVYSISRNMLCAGKLPLRIHSVVYCNYIPPEGCQCLHKEKISMIMIKNLKLHILFFTYVLHFPLYMKLCSLMWSFLLSLVVIHWFFLYIGYKKKVYSFYLKLMVAKLIQLFYSIHFIFLVLLFLSWINTTIPELFFT